MSGTIVAERDIVNGTVEVALPEGLYTIEETSAPQGYQRETQPKRVYLSGKYQEVTFGNEKLKIDIPERKPEPEPEPEPEIPPIKLDEVRIKIKKVDDYKGSDRTDFPLAGAVFRVTSDFINKTFTTDANGLTEPIVTKKGYPVTITEVTAPKGHVRMTKTLYVMGDDKIFDGAEIEVFNAVEAPKNAPFALDIRKTLIGSGSGEALPQLHRGDINFVLAKWSLRDGWTAERTVNALNPDSTVTYANTNAQDVSKIDFSDPAYVINGTPLKENGKVVLDDGIYMLRETKTVPFYSADSSGQFLKNSLVTGKNVFKVENGVISDITLKNANKQVDNGLKPRIGKIVVTKQDKDRQALQGVVFNLYESESAATPLQTVRTDARGVAEFSGLDLKDYWIEEADTHDGFSLLPKRIKLSSYKAIAYADKDRPENAQLIQAAGTYNDTQAQKYYTPANSITIVNNQVFDLPNTGSLLFIVVSCVVVAGIAGGALLLFKRK